MRTNSDCTKAGFPYKGRRYKVWWQGFSGRIHRYGRLVCWSGEYWYFSTGTARRTILCPAIQNHIVRWKLA